MGLIFPSEEEMLRNREAGYLSDNCVQFGYRLVAEEILARSLADFNDMFFFHGENGWKAIEKDPSHPHQSGTNDLTESLYGPIPSVADLNSQKKGTKRRAIKKITKRKCT